MQTQWRRVSVLTVMTLTLVMAGDAFAHTRAARSPQRRMLVEEVFKADEGVYVVLLKTESNPTRYLQIMIAEREALAIKLKMARQAPPRPLTLNLAESILRSTKARLQSVSIDDVRGGVFLGALRLRQKARTWSLDARPSDAIALALGQDVPIWVAQQVLDKASLEPDSTAENVKPTDGAASADPEGSIADLEETL